MSNGLSTGSQITLKAIIWLNRWATAGEIAAYTPFAVREIRAFLNDLHLRRQLSRYRDYYGEYRYARLPELVGVPFRTRGV